MKNLGNISDFDAQTVTKLFIGNADSWSKEELHYMGVQLNQGNKYEGESRLESWLKTVKNHPNYPKQDNEHSAIADAIWNKKLYEFLNTYKPYIENIPAKNNN